MSACSLRRAPFCCRARPRNADHPNYFCQRQVARVNIGGGDAGSRLVARASSVCRDWSSFRARSTAVPRTRSRRVSSARSTALCRAAARGVMLLGVSCVGAVGNGAQKKTGAKCPGHPIGAIMVARLSRVRLRRSLGKPLRLDRLAKAGHFIAILSATAARA